MGKTFEFPEHAAIQTPPAGMAGSSTFTMNWSDLYPITQKTAIETGGDPRAKLDPLTVLRSIVKCRVSDAVLFLTPYFRILSGSPSFPNGLATARFSLVVDNEIFVLDGFLKNHLTDIEGNIPDAAKLEFLKPNKSAYLGKMVSASGPIPGSTFGYFVANESPITIEARGIAAGYGKVEIEAGLVAALYTSGISKKKGA